MPTHYPKRRSRIKRVRTLGFRARMRTKGGRSIIRKQRKMGRRIYCRKNLD